MSSEVKEKDELKQEDVAINEKKEQNESEIENTQESVENQEQKEHIEDIIAGSATTTVLAKDVKTHNDIVQSAKISQEVAKKKYDEYVKVDLELESSSIDLIRQENDIIKTTVDTTISLLNSLNANSLEDVTAQITEIQKDNKEELLHIKTPSKGSAKGFLIGLIGALVTFSGSFIAGAKMANLPLNIATLVEKSNLDKIATKYSELININNSPIAGYSLVAVVSILVGFGLYKLITWLQKKSNIKYINRVESELASYVENLYNKIEDIKDLKQHIENIKLVMQKYDIILQEQNAKIRRMLFIEQPEDGVNSLQRASKLEVEKTVLILDELLSLMNTQVNEGVRITPESNQRLHSANSVINEVIKKLYV